MSKKDKPVAEAPTKSEVPPYIRKPNTRLVGSGDAGSNKFHFCVYEIDDRGNQRIVEELHYTPALGKGLSDQPPFFKEENLNKAIATLKKAHDMFLKYGLKKEEVRIVGTAALRDAKAALIEIAKTADAKTLKKAKTSTVALDNALKPYRLEIISEMKEADLVAKAAAMDLYQNPATDVEELIAAYPAVTVVHFGGRSTECISLASGGVAQSSRVLHSGVHVHDDFSTQTPENPAAAYHSFATELNEKWPRGSQPLLAVSGGAWRALYKLCREGASPVLSRQLVEEKLAFLARQNKEYFVKNGQKRRAAHLAAAAQLLLQLVQHTDAQHIIFLQTKMVASNALALIEECDAHKSATERKLKAVSAEPASEQPYVPAIPLPTRPALEPAPAPQTIRVAIR